jgi:hypothetical protein
MAALRSFPDRGMIIGGIAAIAHGVARTTRGVDATIATVRDVGQLFTEVERFGIYPRIDAAVAYARARQTLLLRHRPTDVDVDLSLAWRPFELDALAAAQDVLLGSVEATVARPEDLVIYKAMTWRPLDQRDVAELARLHGPTMNLERVRRVVAESARSSEDAERVRDFERVLEQVLGPSRS